MSEPMAQSAVSTETPRGRLGAYAYWMARDFLLERFWHLLLIAGLMVVPALFIVGDDKTIVAPIIAAQLSAFAPFLGFLGVRKLISEDREKGFVRLQFAKPVVAWRFYLQRYVVYGIGTIMAALLIVGALNLFSFPVPFAPVRTLAVFYLSFGGIHFLLSALTRYDIALTFGVWGAGVVVPMYAQSGLPFLAPLVYLLPPSYAINLIGIVPHIPHPYPVHPHVWLAGYGLVCLALGVLALRRRPLV